MQNATPFNSIQVSPKRKRVHGALETENSRSTVTIRSQKPGLVEYGSIPRVGFREALQGSLQTSPMDKKVNDDTELNTGEHKVKSKVLEPTVTPELDTRDVVAAKSSPKLEKPEMLQSKPIASPTSSPHHNSPSQVIPALWWEEAEITGHDPKDPTDDGYGINGIGFIPTPAVERTRIELRKRQIAAWKIREAKEARQARSDRRHRDAELGDRGNILGVSNDESKQAKKVRFVEV